MTETPLSTADAMRLLEDVSECAIHPRTITHAELMQAGLTPDHRSCLPNQLPCIVEQYQSVGDH